MRYDFDGIEGEKDGLAHCADDQLTFDAKPLGFIVPVDSTDVVDSKLRELPMDMGVMESFTYPEDTIDCDGLVIPGTKFGTFDCGMIYRDKLYGLVKRNREADFFSYDVGRDVLGRVTKNKFLCCPSEQGFKLGDYQIRYEPTSKPVVRLNDTGKALIRTLILSQVDAKQLYQGLKSAGVKVDGKFERNFIEGWYFEGEPIFLSKLLNKCRRTSE